MMIEKGADPAGVKTRYIYDFSQLVEKPGQATSARMMADLLLANGMNGVKGGLLISEKLQVAVLDLAPGAALPTHQHENEQFTLVAEGEVQACIAGNEHRVGERFVIHVPMNVAHGIIAGARGARIVTVQDTRFAFAG